MPIEDPLAATLANLQNAGLLPAPPPTPIWTGPAETTNLLQPGEEAVADLSDPRHLLDSLSQRTLGAETPGFPTLGELANPAPVAPPQGQDFRVPFDVIGSERGEPDLSDVAGYTPPPPPQAPPPPAIPSVGYGDTAGADAALDRGFADAARSREEATRAQVDSQADLATRQAQAYEDAAMERQLLEKQRVREREAAQKANDAEVATWLDNVTTAAAKEPDPGRWWDDRSGLGKALWALGLLFSSVHAGITPGAQNTVLNMVRQEIDKDVALQQQRLARELDALKLKGSMMDKRHARNLADLMDDHGGRLARLQALEKAWIARTGVPGDAQKAAAMAQVKAEIDAMKLPIIQARWQQAWNQKEHQLQRAHQSREAAMQRAESARQFNADLRYKYDALRTNAAIQLQGKQGGLPETRGVAHDTGLVLLDKSGKPIGDGTIQVRDDKAHQELSELGTAGSELYSKVSRLADLIEKDTSMVKTVGGVIVGELNPEIRALMVDIAYLTAKQNDPGGRFSEMDVSKGGIQKFGFDPDGKTFDRLKYASSKSEIVKMLRKDAANMPALIGKKAAKYLDANLQGQGTRIAFRPQSVVAQEVRQKNASQHLTEMGQPVSATLPDSLKEYREARLAETNPSQAGTVLPEHDRQAVADFEAFVGLQPDGKVGGLRSPDAIRAKALETLEQFKGQPDKWGDNPHDPTPADLNTAKVINMVADEAAKKAEKALKSFDKFIQEANLYRKARGQAPLSLREVGQFAESKRLDMGREVKAIWEKYSK